MMNADLPPSSRNTRLSDSAALAMTLRPVAVEPVNDTTSTRGSVLSIAPIAWSELLTTLSTPGGRSVSVAAMAATAAAAHGVSGAGLRTTVQPAARAGPTLARLIWWGKFHGVIAPTTPAGSRSTHRWLLMPTGDASPRSRFHS